jgi:hypothetical protein
MKIPGFLVLASAIGAQGFNNNNNNNAPPKAPETSRRNVLATAAAAATALLVGTSNPRVALADEDVATPLYFGVGVSFLPLSSDDNVLGLFHF